MTTNASAGLAAHYAAQPAGAHEGWAPPPARVAGQSSQYPLKQLRAFRANLREDAVTHVMTMPLNDAGMRDISAYPAGMGR